MFYISTPVFGILFFFWSICLLNLITLPQSNIEKSVMPACTPLHASLKPKTNYWPNINQPTK